MGKHLSQRVFIGPLQRALTQWRVPHTACRCTDQRQAYSSLSNMYPYSRVPLDPAKKQIRVLCFGAAEDSPNNQMRCSTKVISLGASEMTPYDNSTTHDPSLDANAATKYSAISYTWGDASKRKSIIIDGHEVDVPKNTEIALRRLHANKARDLSIGHGDRQSAAIIFWIDAICINQADLTEKSQQVSMMGEVYDNATEVLIWLGDDNNNGLTTARLIDDVVADCGQATEQFKTLKDTLYPMTSPGTRKAVNRGYFSGGARTPHIIDHHDWSAESWRLIGQLYSTPWFGRVWVVQEVLLARHAVCYYGDVCKSWWEVSLTAAWLSYGQHSNRELTDLRLQVAASTAKTAIQRALALFQYNEIGRSVPYDGQGVSLVKLLLSTATFRCSDPRDQIYALLSLLPSETRRHAEEVAKVSPDYTLPVDTVYAEATRAAICTTQSLAILKRARSTIASDGKFPDLPSWVPRYDIGPDGRRGSVAPVNNAVDTNYFRIPLEVSEMPPLSRNLKVKGYRCSTIHNVGRSIPQMYTDPKPGENEHIMGGILNAVQAISKQVWSFFDAPEDTTSLQARLAVVLACGRTADLKEAQGDTRFLQSFHSFLALSERLAGAVADDIANHRVSTDVLPFFAAVGSSANRQFFITEDDLMGMGPHGVRENDQVCFLLGSSFPFILRQQEDHWILVGDTYVEGLMDGERLRTLHESGQLDAEAMFFDIH